MPHMLSLLTSLLLGLHGGWLQVHAASLPRHNVRAAIDTLHSGIPRPPQAPPIFNDTVESFKKLADELSGKQKTIVDAIVASVDPSNATFENVLLPYLQWENERIQAGAHMNAYATLGTNADVRTAADNASTKINDAERVMYSRQDYFKLVDLVYKRYCNDSSLDPDDLRVLAGPDYGVLQTGMWAHFKNSGQDIKDDSQRARLLEIRNRLELLATEFDHAINNDNSTLFFTAAELEGTGPDFVNSLKKGDGDKLVVPVTDANYITITNTAKNATTRYETYVAYGNKAPSNLERLKEIVTIRDEAARLVGFPDFATYKIKDQMAKTPEAVNEFLAQLQQKLTPAAQKVIDYQKELKKKEEGNADHLYLWDMFYYEVKMDQENNVDETLISEYFETNTTVQRVLDIYSELYGLRLDRISGDDADQLSSTGKGSDSLLHPDQELYAVWDATAGSDDKTQHGDFIGYIYVDLFARDGKAGSGYETPIRFGYTKQDGSKFYPSACAALGVVKSTSEKPTLLSQDDFKNLFHELGHTMHQILSKSKYARMNGPNATPVDMTETPSMLMQNFIYIPKVLKRVGRHYSYISPAHAEVWKKSQGDKKEAKQPEESLPDAQIDSIHKNKNAYSAWEALNQVFLATYDMKIHQAASQQEIKDLDLTTLFNQLRTNMTLLEGPEALGKGWKALHRQTTFGHIGGNAYAAGYYGYQYSVVNALDALYSQFTPDPFSSEAGGRWRRLVLEKGGSQDPETLLEDFLGHKPSDEAYYKDLGITAT